MFGSYLPYATFRQFDIFGTPVNLNINKDNMFRTSFGGSITLFCFFIVSLLCYSTTPIYLEPCTLDHFTSLPNYQYNWTDAFYEQNISNFLCLLKNQTFIIGGVFENEDYHFIKFTVTKCVNSTANPLNPWNPTCESPDVIKANQDEASRIRFLISSNNLNPEKATGSITSYLDSQIFNIQENLMYATANVYINEQTIKTDESIFPIENTHTESLLQFRRSDVWQQTAVGDFVKFCEIFFLRSNYSTFSSKHYLKFDQVISYIGGFCQIFFLVSAFLVRKYNMHILYNELANRLYDFEIQGEGDSSRKKNQSNRRNNQTNNNFVTNLTSPQVKNSESNQRNLLPNSDNPESQIPSTNQMFTKVNSVASPQNIYSEKQEKSDIGGELIPFDQIRKVLTEKGYGNQYYTKNYFPDGNKEQLINGYAATQKYFSKEQNPSETNSGIQKQKNSSSEVKQIRHLTPPKQNTGTKNPFERRNGAKKSTFSQTAIKFEPTLLNENNDIQSKLNELSIEEGQPRLQPIKQYINIELNDESRQIDAQKSMRSITHLIEPQKESERTKLSSDRQENKELMSFGNTKGGETQLNYRQIKLEGEANNNENGYQKFADSTNLFLEKELKLVIDRERSLWVDFKYFINKITCGRFYNTPQIRLLNKALDFVSKDLDIFTILDRQKELDKMKKLFFNEDQQVLFNFFPKPLIKFAEDGQLLSKQSMKDDEKDISRSMSQIQKQKRRLQISIKNIGTVAKAVVKFKKGKKSRMSNYEKLFAHYQNLVTKCNPENGQGSLNKQLIDLLGDEMKNIFEVANKMQEKKQRRNKLPLISGCFPTSLENQIDQKVINQTEIEQEDMSGKIKIRDAENPKQNTQQQQTNLKLPKNSNDSQNESTQKSMKETYLQAKQQFSHSIQPSQSKLKYLKESDVIIFPEESQDLESQVTIQFKNN